jgi:hypothetical protein
VATASKDKIVFAAGYGTVSDIEILWTAIAAIGLFFALFSGSASLQDYKFLKDNHIFNGRRPLAKLGIFNELGRAYVQVIFLLLGIYSALQPEPPAQSLSSTQTIIQGLIRWSFITAGAVVAAKSFATWHTLRKLRRAN